MKPATIPPHRMHPSPSTTRIPVRTALWIAAGMIAGTLLGCWGKLADVTVTVVDQKTALENQILGSYEELDQDVLLLASVRSVDKDGKLRTVSEVPPGKKKAIRAKQRQEFNHDDIVRFKQEGAAGEGATGYLVFFATEKIRSDPKYRKFVETLIQEENQDRRVIYERIVATNAAFGEEDLPKVERISASLNLKNAQQGEKIQLEDGAWTVQK